MKNIERFNLYTAHIFAMLYEKFPVPTMIHGGQVVTGLRRELDILDEEEGQQRRVVLHTLHWLEVTGYIRSNDPKKEDPNRTFVLEPRAFEAMAQPLPKSLKAAKDDTRSVGDKLVDVAGRATGGVLSDIRNEVQKQVVAKLVGEVIGHAMRAWSGH